MLFTSVEFIAFLAVAVLTYHATPSRYRKLHLLVFSYIYYFSWSAAYSLLLLAATAAAYFTGLGAARAKTEAGKKRAMAGGVIFLAAALAVFKYFNVFTESFSALYRTAHWDTNRFVFELAVPVGISYYTFRLISYVVDVYWEKIPAEKDFIAFAAYTAFFPQILSGPIQRADSFLPQVRSQAPVPYEMMASGLRLILFGFFKKLVIADRLGLYVDVVYNSPSTYNTAALVIAAYGFMFQLYADFSGITDIARGASRLFGIESPKNFDAPFLAPNIQQYWRKWHMSLTNWLADYVFMPLHMKFRNWGNFGLSLAILINMIAIGLWHGARWTYVIFGLIHAVYMIVSALTLKKRDKFFKGRPVLARMRAVWAPFVTFNLVVFASIFFRADTAARAWTFLLNLAALNTSKVGPFFFAKKDILIILIGTAIMEIIHYLESRGRLRRDYLKQPAALRLGFLYGMSFFILILGEFTARNFIYFKF